MRFFLFAILLLSFSSACSAQVSAASSNDVFIVGDFLPYVGFENEFEFKKNRLKDLTADNKGKVKLLKWIYVENIKRKNTDQGYFVYADIEKYLYDYCNGDEDCSVIIYKVLGNPPEGVMMRSVIDLYYKVNKTCVDAIKKSSKQRGDYSDPIPKQCDASELYAISLNEAGALKEEKHILQGHTYLNVKMYDSLETVLNKYAEEFSGRKKLADAVEEEGKVFSEWKFEDKLKFIQRNEDAFNIVSSQKFDETFRVLNRNGVFFEFSLMPDDVRIRNAGDFVLNKVRIVSLEDGQLFNCMTMGKVQECDNEDVPPPVKEQVEVTEVPSEPTLLSTFDKDSLTILIRRLCFQQSRFIDDGAGFSHCKCMANEFTSSPVIEYYDEINSASNQEQYQTLIRIGFPVDASQYKRYVNEFFLPYITKKWTNKFVIDNFKKRSEFGHFVLVGEGYVYDAYKQCGVNGLIDKPRFTKYGVEFFDLITKTGKQFTNGFVGDEQPTESAAKLRDFVVEFNEKFAGK